MFCRLRTAILALSMGFCGFAVTAAALPPRDCPIPVDQNGEEQVGILSGVRAMDCPAVQARYTIWSEQGGGKIRFLKPDRYGRAVVILNHKRVALQEELLREGLVILYDASAAPKAWVKAEAEAKAARSGCWGRRDSFIAAADAHKHFGEFVLVSGTVLRSYKGRDMIYLNFGEDWHEDFSVSIAKRYWRAFGSTLDALEGKTIRVRGVILLENGPMIRLTRPEQLEVMPSRVAAGGSKANEGLAPLQGDKNANQG